MNNFIRESGDQNDCWLNNKVSFPLDLKFDYTRDMAMNEQILHIYVRVSSESSAEKGLSIQAQKDAGIAKAHSLGLKYIIHEEPGKSAKYDNLDNRPILQNLLNLCDEKKVKFLFSTEQDRLTRSPILWYYIQKICIDNNVIIYTTSNRIDLSDADHEFMSHLSALMAKRENTLRVKRTVRALKLSVEKGRWLGPLVPYGYTKCPKEGVLIPDPEEHKVYLMMVEWSLKGYGTKTIARKLNDLGIQTRGRKVLKNGTKVQNKFTKKYRKVTNEEFVWRDGTIYCILTNPIYKGERRYKGGSINSPMLLDGITWDRVQDNLKKNKRISTSNNSKHFYLLKGLMRCKRCGANLYGRVKTDENYYMCSSKRYSSCSLRSVNRPKLDSLVWNLVIDSEYHREEVIKKLKAEETPLKISVLEDKLKKIKSELNGLEKRRDNLYYLFETDRLSVEAFDQRNGLLETESVQLQDAYQSLSSELKYYKNNKEYIERLNLNHKSVRKLLKNYSEEQKRELLKLLVKEILIDWDEKKRTHYITVEFRIADLKLICDGEISPIGVFWNEAYRHGSPEEDATDLVKAFSIKGKIQKDGVEFCSEDDPGYFMMAVLHRILPNGENKILSNSLKFVSKKVPFIICEGMNKLKDRT